MGQFTLCEGQVFWRGENMAERLLADGEEIPCGMVMATVRAQREYSSVPVPLTSPQADAPVLPAPMFSVVRPVSPWTLREGGKEYDLSSRAITMIGRAQDNDVVLGDGSVSSRHARLECEGEMLSIFDSDSTNGTFVGDARLAPRIGRILREGDVVRLGQTQLIVARRLFNPLRGNFPIFCKTRYGFLILSVRLSKPDLRGAPARRRRNDIPTFPAAMGVIESSKDLLCAL